MLKTGRVAALIALSAALAACGGGGARQATGDVQAFLAAVQDRDRTAFEAWVDRPALRRDLRSQVMELGRAAGLEVDGGPSEFALDRMITPDNVRLTDPDGFPLAAPPSAEQTKAMLKRLDGRHICVHDASPAKTCLLTFEKQKPKGGKAAWRLVRMPAQHVAVIAPRVPEKG